MAVCRDKLLITSTSMRDLTPFLIYSLLGQHISNFTIVSNGGLQDAIWTPSCNIVYTTSRHPKIFVVSQEGEFKIMHTRLPHPKHLSVSKDNVIYATDSETGVHMSSDEGYTWEFVFNHHDRNKYLASAIKISHDRFDNFWTLPGNSGSTTGVYILKKGANTTSKYIKVLPLTDPRGIVRITHMVFDGNSTILTLLYGDKTIYALSSDGNYRWQIKLSNFTHSEPLGLAISREHHQLFVSVGLRKANEHNCTIMVFEWI